MQIIKNIDEMRSWSAQQRRDGKSIAFVPTMGALHEGHVSLLHEGKRQAQKLVLSIYLNPTQFAPSEDLDNYPRNLDDDLKKAAAAGTDAVFLPSDKTIYPHGYSTYVVTEGLGNALCGKSRPNHFRGVTTVVSKLFNIVTLDIAIFGEKDFQQLAIIRRMTEDLNLPVKIMGCPTVRESDGIAMSSRNAYLSQEERKSATLLSQSLKKACDMVAEGTTDAQTIRSEVESTISAAPHTRIDYVEIVDPSSLERVNEIAGPALLALAVFVGKTRLIDNVTLAPEELMSQKRQ
jgi:pantoate--beta-alanine ligase